MEIALKWSTGSDLDLHVMDPCDGHISYLSRHRRCGPHLGELDKDMNAGGPGNRRNPIEHVNWQPDAVPIGDYRVFVNLHSRHGFGGTIGYSVVVKIDRDRGGPCLITRRGADSTASQGSRGSEVVVFKYPPDPADCDP